MTACVLLHIESVHLDTIFVLSIKWFVKELINLAILSKLLTSSLKKRRDVTEGGGSAKCDGVWRGGRGSKMEKNVTYWRLLCNTVKYPVIPCITL